MNAHFDEALRTTLHPDAAPAELREALLGAARRQDRLGRVDRVQRRRQLGLAAALMLVLGLGVLWLRERTRAGGTAVAQAALTDFMASHDLAFDGPPPGEDACACWSKACVGFPAALPKSCPRLDVSGGRGCRVKGMAAACYLLRDGRSLYVLAKPIPGAGAVQGRPLAVAASYQAKAWNENGLGYILVAPR